MPRKPSASHCVQKLPPLLYSPSRRLFSCGLIAVTTSSWYAPAGGASSVSDLSVTCGGFRGARGRGGRREEGWMWRVHGI
jgi:hypothetical protein